jgi:hypothetical protein
VTHGKEGRDKILTKRESYISGAQCNERVRVGSDRLRSISSTHSNAELFHHVSKSPEYRWRTNTKVRWRQQE